MADGQKLRPQDPWSWLPAAGTDITDMVSLTQRDFECEADTIFRTDPLVMSRNLTQAVVRQFYNPSTEMVWLARHDDTAAVVGYVWAERGQRAAWSDDEMVAVKIVHVDLSLSVRQRVTLCDQMIFLWENWARSIGVPIVCSTTMRGDQTGFLRLHQRRGYDVRGSIAYKRFSSEITLQV